MYCKTCIAPLAVVACLSLPVSATADPAPLSPVVIPAGGFIESCGPSLINVNIDKAAVQVLAPNISELPVTDVRLDVQAGAGLQLAQDSEPLSKTEPLVDAGGSIGALLRFTLVDRSASRTVTATVSSQFNGQPVQASASIEIPLVRPNCKGETAPVSRVDNRRPAGSTAPTSSQQQPLRQQQRYAPIEDYYYQVRGPRKSCKGTARGKRKLYRCRRARR